MRNLYILLVIISFLLPTRIVFSAACSSSSGSDFNCCQAGGTTTGTKLTLSDTDETTRKCSWPADDKFQFTIKRIGLLPKGGTEASIVYKGASLLFNAGAFDAGETMGNFLAGANFPNGTYEAIIPEIALSETVQALTAPTIIFDSTNRTCDTNSVTHQQQPGESDFMCVGQSAISVDEDDDGTNDYTVPVGTFRSDYGPDIEVCFLDEDGNGVADTMRIHENELGDIVIGPDSNFTISLSFNASDGVIYSVYDDIGFGDISSPVACTAVDVGDLDVSISRE